MSIWQVVETEFRCDHPLDKRELRYRLDSLNRPQYLMQCTVCGQKATQALKKAHLPNLQFIPSFDEALAEGYQAQKQARYQQLVDEENQRHASKQTDWFIEYNRYLQSPEWREKRRKVLARDKYLCQACLESKATQVHHKSYDHVFHEPLFELVAVCEDCHNSLTELDTQRRNNNGVANVTTRITLS